MIVDNPELIEDMRERINDDPVDFDSETTIARHLTRVLAQSTERLGISNTKLLSADGFLWVYSMKTGTWSRLEVDDIVTLVQLYDGTYTSENKPKRVRIGYQKSVNIAKSTHRLHGILGSDFFASPRPGIPCANGFLTVSACGVEVTPHDPDNRATVGYDIDVGADENEDPPLKWLEFLRSVWAGDEDRDAKINVLQEFCGAAIAGLSTEYQRCLLLLGYGSNGKSLLCEFIAELMFPEGTATFISPRRWDRDYSIAGLKDARINIVSELPETSAMESADIFKAVIAGDRLEARLPYQAPHFIRPSAGHVFSANEIPRTSDTSHGFFRRFITMKFGRNFEDDPDRKTKTEIMGPLMEERGAIIMWALVGASRLIRRGEYPTVASHSETVQDWKKSSCAVIDFVDSCIDVGVGTTPLAELMAEFQEWAPTVGRSPNMTARTLSDRLVKTGMIKKRMGSGIVFPCSIRTTQNRRVAT